MNLPHTISSYINRKFPTSFSSTLRKRYLTLQRQLNPVKRFVFGSFNTQDLRQHLEEKLDSDFEILMVHSSLNNMAPMYTGSALELINMLIDFCGPDRTLVMPAFYFGDEKIGNVHDTFNENPIFNLKRVPSQMGIMTELFRRWRGVIQSRHPIYRVAALGPLAKELTQGHENASGSAGKNSPFDFMANHNTLVIGIGKSFHVMTQVHHVDDLMGEDFPVPRVPAEKRIETQITIIDGKEEIPMIVRGNGIHWRINISKLPKLLAASDMSFWKFHNVPLFAAKAKEVTQSLIKAGKQGQSLYEPD